MAENWDALFRDSIHPYQDRHWLWQVFPELFPLPPTHHREELKSYRFVCPQCRQVFLNSEVDKCTHAPAYSSAVDLSYAKLRGVAVQFAPPAPSQQLVLDAGCGTGASAIPLLEKNGGVHVSAVDFSERAILQLRQRPFFDARRLDAEVADILLLPPSHRFDFVLANFVISSIPDVQKALVSLKNQLNERGVLLILDYTEEDYRIKRREHQECSLGKICYRNDGTVLIGFNLVYLRDFLSEIGLTVHESFEWQKEEKNRKTGEQFCRNHFVIKACVW